MYTIIGVDGNEYGPVTAAVVKEWITSGRANAQTRIKRADAVDWTTIGALTEFADAPQSQPPPGNIAAPGDAPTAAGTDIAVGRSESFQFTGEWTEYFKIWIVNVLLTIVTLGIYAAWAKVRKRRYFHANTKLLGHTFEYLANPVRILIGNIIIVVLFFGYSFAGAISPLVQLPMLLVLLVAIPWIVVRALSFNARNTAWRGLRFHFRGQYGEAAKAFILWPMLVPFTLGLIWPVVAKRQKEFIINKHSYGTTPFKFNGLTSDLYGIFLRSIPFFLPIIAGYVWMVVTVVVHGAAKRGGHPDLPNGDALVMGLFFLIGFPLAIAGSVYFRSRFFNFIWNTTSIGGHQFTAHMRARDLFGTQFVNSIVTAITLGLMYPWAAMRMYQFHLDCLQVISAGNIDQFVAGAEPPPGSAVGDAATDFLDIDLGFGT